MPINFHIKNQKLTFFQWLKEVEQNNFIKNRDWRLNAYLKKLIYRNVLKIQL